MFSLAATVKLLLIHPKPHGAQMLRAFFRILENRTAFGPARSKGFGGERVQLLCIFFLGAGCLWAIVGLDDF